MKVLTKKPLTNYIRIMDLRELLENFGVKEYDQASQSNEEEMSETDDPRKHKKKNMNFDALTKESLNVLASLTDYLLDTDTSVYEFFDGMIYNQVVRTKNKQSTVEIISGIEFFNKIKTDKEFMKNMKSELINSTTEGNF
jgi:hypothetical protein